MKFGVHLRLLAKPDLVRFHINGVLLKNIVKGGSVDDGAECSNAGVAVTSQTPPSRGRHCRRWDAASSNRAQAHFVLEQPAHWQLTTTAASLQ